jgi:hypothetical protein
MTVTHEMSDMTSTAHSTLVESDVDPAALRRAAKLLVCAGTVTARILHAYPEADGWFYYPLACWQKDVGLSDEAFTIALQYLIEIGLLKESIVGEQHIRIYRLESIRLSPLEIQRTLTSQPSNTSFLFPPPLVTDELTDSVAASVMRRLALPTQSCMVLSS